MSRSRITRRQFILRTGGAVGALVVMKPGKAMADDDPSTDQSNTLYGYVAAVNKDGSLTVRGPASGDETSIQFADGAEFWREGPVDLSVFGPGDEVVAVGAWSGATFVATYLTSAYRGVYADVLEESPDSFVTDAGTMDLAPQLRLIDDDGIVATPVQDIAVGDQVFAFGRVDGSSGDLVALGIGVVEGG